MVCIPWLEAEVIRGLPLRLGLSTPEYSDIGARHKVISVPVDQVETLSYGQLEPTVLLTHH